MEAIKGKRMIYLWRVLGYQGTESAATIAFVTENSRSVSKSADSTATKDGSIRTPGETTVEMSFSSILAKGDRTIDVLEEAMKKDQLIECWEVNLDEQGTEKNKFKSTYYQGYFTSLEVSASSDGFVTISMNYGANGEGAPGYATVTDEQQAAAAYVFTDTPATGSLGTLTVTSAAGSAIGKTKLTVKGATSEDPIYFCKVSDSTLEVKIGDAVTDWTAWDGTSDVIAENGKKITVAEVNNHFRVIAKGEATVTAKTT